MRGRTPRWRWLAAGGGAVMAVAALVAAFAWDSIFDAALVSQLALHPTSHSFHEWLSPSTPLYFDVYAFNWTNADKFPEEKPKFKELGPYRFRERRSHVNITWHTHNNTLGYRTLRSWQFDKDGSRGSWEDNITTLNVIAASAVYKYRHYGFVRQKGLSVGLAIFDQKVSVSKKAGQLLFDGYDDQLLDLARSMSSTSGAPDVDKFGWFYGRNNSIDTDGYMEVTTGDHGLPGQILKWNHLDHLPYYSGDCAKLSGSAGEFLPHNLTEESVLSVFVPDLCRTIHLDYVDSGAIGGLEYHKYAVSPVSFDNSTLSFENTCFCNGECMWGGVMNLSSCRFSSPTFISLPHFLHADPVLRDMVEGMAPDPDKHSFYFAVEPKLGVPLDVAGRFQFNVFIQPMENIALYEKVPRMLFPIFWVEQAVTVGEPVFAELRMVRAIHDWGPTVCACACVFFLFFIVGVTTCCTGKGKKYSKPTDLSARIEKDEAEVKLKGDN